MKFCDSSPVTGWILVVCIIALVISMIYAGISESADDWNIVKAIAVVTVIDGFMFIGCQK